MSLPLAHEGNGTDSDYGAVLAFHSLRTLNLHSRVLVLELCCLRKALAACLVCSEITFPWLLSGP